MKALTIMALAFTLLSSCGKSQQPVSSQPPAPILLYLPTEFTVYQRSTTPLPGSNGKILLTIDDITWGQVMVNLSWENGKPIVATRSLRQNDVVTFTASNHVYKIRLKKLENFPLGNDKATFQLWPAANETNRPLSEDQRIEGLIDSLKKLDEAQFIRNGQEHTLDEAITHMRTKWEWKKAEIKTAEDFIRIAGSISSTSGQPYIIRMPDGTEIKTEDWFREQLKLMDKLPNQRIDNDNQ